MLHRDLNNFNFENFTLFVNDKPTIPISYDWKLIRENIQCPIYDKNYLCTELVELFGSQLYIRNYHDENSFWKKFYYPGISIDYISSNGDVNCYQFNYDSKNWSINEKKNYKLKWVEPIYEFMYEFMYELNNYYKNIIIVSV